MEAWNAVLMDAQQTPGEDLALALAVALVPQ
jgi:hypothetical protein